MLNTKSEKDAQGSIGFSRTTDNVIKIITNYYFKIQYIPFFPFYYLTCTMIASKDLNLNQRMQFSWKIGRKITSLNDWKFSKTECNFCLDTLGKFNTQNLDLTFLYGHNPP